MKLAAVACDGQHFVFDPTRVERIDACLFDPAWWRTRGAVRGQATGRGAAWFVAAPDGARWVLRHNRRGGALARINHDLFLATSATRLRPLAELRLLAWMREHGLPVPLPVAARAVRVGPFYRADVITEALAETTPLADRLAETSLACADWARLGAVIARFHTAGVEHADLNARNVLVDANDVFHLIDFDKSRRRVPGRWRQANLARLKRSLDKFAAAPRTFHFNAADWRALLDGYAGTTDA